MFCTALGKNTDEFTEKKLNSIRLFNRPDKSRLSSNIIKLYSDEIAQKIIFKVSEV